MHLSSSRNAEAIGGLTVGYAKRDVAEKLAVKSCAEMARGNELTLFAREGRIVDREGHFHRRLANLDEFKRLDSNRRANGVSYLNILTAREAYYITDLCFGNLRSLKTVELIERDDLRGAGFSILFVIVTNRNALTLLDGAALYSSDSYSADKFVIVDRGNEKLKRLFLFSLGSGHIFDNGIKKGLKIGARGMGIEGCRSRSARAEEHRGIELLVGCIKLEKKLKNLVTDLVKTGIGTVDLVYDNDYSVIHRKCLFKHEASLRHRPLCRVNEKDNAVYHFEYALYLAAEIGVTGSIYDVDFNVLIIYCGVLCKNCYTALAFKIVRVHYAVGGLLIFAVYTALTKHFVNKSCFTVVNVRDYSDIS